MITFLLALLLDRGVLLLEKMPLQVNSRTEVSPNLTVDADDV
jgi:hypothetical protein